MKNNYKKSNSFKKGCSVQFEKTIGEQDILQFAEISGDFSPNHIDKKFMENSIYGKCIAHGALLVAYMSKASSLILEEYPNIDFQATAVSLGYDKIRFIKPVFVNDTINVKYEVLSYDQKLKRSNSSIEIVNQNNKLVAVASHILKWVPNP